MYDIKAVDECLGNRFVRFAQRGKSMLAQTETSVVFVLDETISQGSMLHAYGKENA